MLTVSNALLMSSAIMRTDGLFWWKIVAMVIMLYSALFVQWLLLKPSSSSCHQTVVFHLSTQDYAVSLNFERSPKAQGRARRVHCNMCAVFSVVRPHTHVVSPSKYCHFFRCSLLHV